MASAGGADAWSTSAPVVGVGPPVMLGQVVVGSAQMAPLAGNWLSDLEREAKALLDAGQTDVWDHLTKLFEARLIHTALELTRGRRIEAAQKLGIGRNTITRKIQELGMDD